jgi:transcriptional regulator with XRE-family HTH domain
MISSEQIKAARAMLGWTQDDLIQKSGLSPTTIKRMETIGPGRSSAANLAAVQSALEDAGVIFIAENGEGPGVRLRKPIKGE